MDARKLIFILIGFICVISIIFTIFSQFNYKKPSSTIENILPSATLDETELINSFGNIFSNKINYQNNNTSNINKIDYTKELVYTSFEINENTANKYTINAKIPAININQNSITLINNEIETTFKAEISNIIAQSADNSNKLYDVEYAAYLNSNILSLVVKATKKDGNLAQRVIVKTYNYNITSNEVVKLEQILNLKGISNTYAKKKIKEKITKANSSSESLKNLGYSVYTRDLNSKIYEIENTSTFFLGENGILYVLYPYGNANMTSEMDIIIF